MNSEVRFYLRVLLRRLPLLLFVAVLISSVGIAVAILRPPVYTSSGQLLVQQAQIPEDMARTTVRLSAREQLTVVQRRLLTRSNLLEIARANQVYENLAELTPDEIVSRMRSDSTFRLTGGGVQSDVTIMTVGFTARDPVIAARVANEYITRILRDNSEQRQAEAQDTLAFFQQEVDRLEAELTIRSSAILDFQTANQNALPSSLQFRVARQSSLQERLINVTRDERVLEQRARNLRDSLENFAVAVPEAAMSPVERQLVQLRNELSSALAVYTNESPRVQTLRNRVEALEGQLVARQGPSEPSENAGESDLDANPVRRRMESELAEIELQLDFIAESRARIENELDELVRTIPQTAINGLRLAALERELESVRLQHAQATGNLATAARGERIEVLSKGQRVSVLEQAVPPDEPTSPNRRLLAATGVAAGLASGSGLVILLELLTTSIRRPEDITTALGITPLATVPYITTPWERARRRSVPVILLLAILLGIPAGLYYVHSEVMPLDLLVDRVSDRIFP